MLTTIYISVVTPVSRFLHVAYVIFAWADDTVVTLVFMRHACDEGEAHPGIAKSYYY